MPQLCKPRLLQGWWDGRNVRKENKCIWCCATVMVSAACGCFPSFHSGPWKPSMRLAPSWGLSLGTHVWAPQSGLGAPWRHNPLILKMYLRFDLFQLCVLQLSDLCITYTSPVSWWRNLDIWELLHPRHKFQDNRKHFTHHPVTYDRQ